MRAAGIFLLMALLSLEFGWATPAAAWDPLQKARRAAQEAGEHLAAGETSEAVDAYARAQALNPEVPEYRMGLGEALFAGEEYESAMSQFLAAADPEQPGLARRALYNAGNTALASGDAEKALSLYERALLVDEPDPDLLHNLELAQRLLEQAEQQQQQQDDQQQDQENQEQQEDQEQQEQEQQNQPEQEPQQDPEQQEQDEEQEQEQEQEEQAPPDSLEVPPPPPDSTQVAAPDSILPPPEGMSPEEAMRMLEALDHDEEELRRSIQRRLRGTETESENDW